jgi:hypothetical protein
MIMVQAGSWLRRIVNLPRQSSGVIPGFPFSRKWQCSPPTAQMVERPIGLDGFRDDNVFLIAPFLLLSAEK